MFWITSRGQTSDIHCNLTWPQTLPTPVVAHRGSFFLVMKWLYLLLMMIHLINSLLQNDTFLLFSCSLQACRETKSAGAQLRVQRVFALITNYKKESAGWERALMQWPIIPAKKWCFSNLFKSWHSKSCCPDLNTSMTYKDGHISPKWLGHTILHQKVSTHPSRSVSHGISLLITSKYSHVSLFMEYMLYGFLKASAAGDPLLEQHFPSGKSPLVFDFFSYSTGSRSPGPNGPWQHKLWSQLTARGVAHMLFAFGSLLWCDQTLI